jgi:exosortase
MFKLRSPALTYVTILNYLVWGLTAILYTPVFYQLYHGRWEYIDYTHAYFILPVSLWLVWRKRTILAGLAARSQPKSLALALVIFSLLLFFFGWRQDYLMITTVSLLSLSFGLGLYCYGTAFTKAITFPIVYLLLLVPPPLGVLDSITLPMRYGISIITAQLLSALHFPIIRDGLLLQLGDHEVYMGAPCSGFRSLISLISLGLVYVYLARGSLKKKAILVFSIIPLALLGNLLRVTGVCLVTFYWGDAAGHTFHDASGFAIFLVLLGGLVGLEALLNSSLSKKARSHA